jgi:hypothetical protein
VTLEQRIRNTDEALFAAADMRVDESTLQLARTAVAASILRARPGESARRLSLRHVLMQNMHMRWVRITAIPHPSRTTACSNEH